MVCGDRSNRNERLDIVTWCSVFDFIPCLRDVFDGLSCFVWWTALCAVSGYAICQYVYCDVIGWDMMRVHINS